MAGAVLCMAFYNVWSRPYIVRSSALGFLALGMGSGAAALVVAGLLTGRMAVLATFGSPQWIAGLYLGIAGGALAFILWVMALQRASPTRVANTMTVNPIAAALLASQLVGEPITLNLVIGLVAVFVGIWLATTEGTCAGLVPEVAHPGEHHGEALLVRRIDHFLVAHRAAGLDDGGGAGFGGGQQPVGEGEEGVGGHDAADAGLSVSPASSPASAARMAAMREESRRFIWPAPTPTVAPSLA